MKRNLGFRGLHCYKNIIKAVYQLNYIFIVYSIILRLTLFSPDKDLISMTTVMIILSVFFKCFF